MRHSHSFAALALALAAPTLLAQSSVLFVIDDTCNVFSSLAAYSAAGTLLDDEIGLVTPLPGAAYGASPFLSLSTQWAFLGDHDADGDFVESGSAAPGNEPDAILIHRLRPAPAVWGPRDVFVSKASDLTRAWEDGDVFRFSGQGTLEFFLTEAQVLVAIGQTGANDNVDVDAICMDASGDLFLSFDATETVNGSSAEDGSIVFIPAAAITYDANLDVSSIAAGAAVVLANESDIAALIVASGVRDARGATPPTTTSDVELSALEIDPNGGTFTSPLDPNLVVPNLLFSWDDADNDGAVLSTAGGGSFAVVNGVPLASAVATTGTQLGLIPNATGTDGVFALGLIPPQLPPLVLENWPTNSYSISSPLYDRQEVAGATPGGVVVFFIDLPVGSVFPAIAISGFGGDAYGAGLAVPIGVATADANGNAANTIDIPASIIGGGGALVWEALDLSSLSFAWPGATDF